MPVSKLKLASLCWELLLLQAGSSGQQHLFSLFSRMTLWSKLALASFLGRGQGVQGLAVGAAGLVEDPARGSWPHCLDGASVLCWSVV